MEFEDWLLIGLQAGFCGPAVCSTHDGIPLSDDEVDEFDEGDPCVHIIRLYADDEQRAAVEAAHPPSVWRRPPEVR